MLGTGFGQPEFRCLLDRVDGITAGIGEGDDLSLRGLRLEEERGEVGSVEWMTDGAKHFASAALDEGRGVAFKRVTEGVVCGDEKPGIATLLHQRAAGHRRKSVSVESPVDSVRRAELAGEIRRGSARIDVDGVARARYLAHGESHGRVGNV